MKQKYRIRLVKLAISMTVGYALVCFVLFLFQRSLLYHPTHHPPGNALSPWKVEGQTIGYCHEVPNPQTVWLMMHGNAGQAADRGYVLSHLASTDSLYVLEYPGYGSRSGKPSREAIDQAAEEAYEQLCKRYPKTPIGVIGESIGSGPASHLANATIRPERIVLIVPFDTLQNVASRTFFFLPVHLLLQDKWDNIASLESYDGPIDIFGATEDNIIPIEHARNLAKHCQNATFHEVPCGHNDWSRRRQVFISRPGIWYLLH